MSSEYVLDNTPRVRRVIQTVSDLRRGNLTNCRLLDLGCAHGAYTIEFARRGANALGVDGRAAWIKTAEEFKRTTDTATARFEVADVRHLSRETHGVFDVILCLGLLYHLSAEDAAALIRQMRSMCEDFIIIDTQIALEPTESRIVSGEKYHGWTYREHDTGAEPEQKMANLGASLDEEVSFWFTRPSLLNLIKDAGFSSVMEVKNPLDNMYLNGEFKVHEDVVTLAGFAGRSVGEFVTATAEFDKVERWPEAIEPFILERPWTKPRQSSPKVSLEPEPASSGPLAKWLKRRRPVRR